MNMKINLSVKWYQRNAAVVLFSGIISSLILIFAMKLWHADLSYSLTLGSGDVLLERMGIQNMLETGSRNLSNRLGGYSGQQLYDYPVSDAFNYGMMRIIALFTGNSATVMNIFYLIGFPLAAMTATAALLRLGITRIVALFSGLFYPFMPYHFARNQNHLLLSAYYMVPLAIVLALGVLEGEYEPVFSKKQKWRRNLYQNRKLIGAVVTGLIISSTGVYYAYFSCFFILLALITFTIRNRRRMQSIFGGAMVMASIVIGALLNAIPGQIYALNGGESFPNMLRSISDGETYSLKLIDLFIPYYAHNLGRFRNMVQIFHNSESLANENTAVSLGILGSFGLAALLLAPIVVRSLKTAEKRLFRNTSLLAIYGILLATLGGFSSIIYRYIFGGVRAYNRICVFLFFMALIALSLCVDAVLYGKGSERRSVGEIAETHPRRARMTAFWRKWSKFLAVGLVPLLGLGLFDLIPVNVIPAYQTAEQYESSTRQYFVTAEASLPSGSYVFVLPYVAFPEPQAWYGSGPFANMEPYFYTQTLHFSYGAMVGGKEDSWYKATAALPADEMIAALRKAGYSAIYFDLTNNTDDKLTQLKNDLVTLAGTTPIVSDNGGRFFFSI